MNKFSILRFIYKNRLRVLLIFFLGLGAFLFYQVYRKSGPKYKYIYRYLPLHKESLVDIHEQTQWENTRREELDNSSPAFPGVFYPDMNPSFQETGRPAGGVMKRGKVSNGFSLLSREKKFSDIATLDHQRQGYYLKNVHPSQTSSEVLEAMSDVLRILDRQDVPADYFLCNEYQKAYDIIDTYYFDVNVWSHLTNETAKENLFLYLFTKYAEDNKNWKLYEKDVSDCTQYTQRIYLFMEPGEVFIEEDYFQFLFSEERHIEERKKLCNKIPTVLYALLEPYALKKEEDTLGHAMIAFASDEKWDQLILGEPQTGEFRYIEENIDSILDQEYTKNNIMFHLGKVIDIQEDMKHEATINIVGGYFFPQPLLEDDNTDHEFEKSPNDKPILLNSQDWYVCNLLSSCIGETLSNQSINWSNLLYALEDTFDRGNLSQDQAKQIMSTSIDVISYGLNGLNSSEIETLRSNMFSVNGLGEGYQINSTQMNTVLDSLHDFFYEF